MASDYDFEELYANTYTESDRLAYENQPVSEKKFFTTWLLALTLGIIGAHRFYLGMVAIGMIKTVLACAAVILLVLEQQTIGLLILGIAMAWVLIDLILLLTGTLRDRKDHQLQGYQRLAGRCAAVTVLAVVILLVVAMVIGSSTAVSGS